jgi:hypothetical protein
MKTSIKTIIAVTLTAVVLTIGSQKSFAADGEKITTLSEVKKVNKINVSGNVELILVQSTAESVRVYDEYYSKNALIQQKNGELRISSFEQKTLTVVVYVNNLTSITAANNASVKTRGAWNTLSLTVNLSDNATASLNTNTIDLNTDLSGIAKLTLNGSTENYTASMGSFAKVNMDQFAAETKSIQSKNAAVARVVVKQALTLPEAE